MMSRIERLPPETGRNFPPESNSDGRVILLWLPVLALMAFGLVMVYSASAVMTLRKYSDSLYFLKRQVLFAAVGVAVAWGASRVPYPWYRLLSRWILGLAFALLVLVLVPGVGREFNAARRWLPLGPLSFQPSEIVKVAWIVYLSAYLAEKREVLQRFRQGLFPVVLLFGVLAGLLLMEPDFGAVCILAGVTAVMLLAGGIPWRHLMLFALPAFLGFYLAVVRVPYRLERITAFTNPWTDPLDSGYHLIQSWIAVGSGGLWGKGLGASQQKLFYLPEPFTDFVFAVLGEELGFVGIAVLVALFFVFFWKALNVAQDAPEPFGSFLGLGLAFLIPLQAWINMGVVLGLLPTKGLTLPFISYGGSSFLANCLAVGILLNIARRSDMRAA
jgi:cell division protein FtsW